MNFSDFLIWCFYAYLEVICKKWWRKCQNSALLGQKTALFLPFSQFFGLKNLSSEWIFLFFLIWCFWACLEAICKKSWKKGSKFFLEGPKMSYFGYFCSFLDMEFFLMNELSNCFLWCFWAYLEVIYKKLWKKGSNFEGLKNNMIFQISQKLASNLAPSFAIKCSNL